MATRDEAARPSRFRQALLIAATLLAALVAVAVFQLRPPAWWAPITAVDDAMHVRAERFEQAFVSEMHRVRGEGGPWAIRIRESDINEWLAARLPLWCDHAGIERIGAVQVRLTAEAIELAIETPELPALAVVRARPLLDEKGLRPSIEAARLGRLALPILGDRAVRTTLLSLGEEDNELFALLAVILRNEPIAAAFELGDGRRLRLRDLEVREDEMLLEFETLLEANRPAAGAAGR
jgi:hypothetical protein